MSILLLFACLLAHPVSAAPTAGLSAAGTAREEDGLRAAPASAVQASTQSARMGAPSLERGRAPSAQGAARMGAPSAEDRIKEKIRQDLLAVRRARYALRKAKLSGDREAEAKAEAALLEAKRALKMDRLELQGLLKPAGAASKGAERAR